MQSYTEIAGTTFVKDSLAQLLSNDKTAMSCSSGTAFPTANLQVGMLCFRTDTNKLYALKDATPTWVLVADLTKSAALQAFQGSLAVITTAATNLIPSITTAQIWGSISNNGSRLTVGVAGTYLVRAKQLINTGGAGMYFHVRKNGGTLCYGYSANAAGTLIDIHDSVIVDMAVGDYIDFFYTAITYGWASPHSSVHMNLIG